MNKFLIVGLGNIGEEYEDTRHNIGFKVLDRLADFLGIKFTLGRLAYYGQINYRGKKIILIKPTTYMNLSGNAVRYWRDKENISIQNILVITDDIFLETGIFRLRKKGSDGGHNGLKSINSVLGTQEYPRFRFGIGNDFTNGRQADYVLGKWTKEQNNILDVRLEDAIKGVELFIFQGIDITMNRYNN